MSERHRAGRMDSREESSYEKKLTLVGVSPDLSEGEVEQWAISFFKKLQVWYCKVIKLPRSSQLLGWVFFERDCLFKDIDSYADQTVFMSQGGKVIIRLPRPPKDNKNNGDHHRRGDNNSRDSADGQYQRRRRSRSAGDDNRSDETEENTRHRRGGRGERERNDVESSGFLGGSRRHQKNDHSGSGNNAAAVAEYQQPPPAPDALANMLSTYPPSAPPPGVVTTAPAPAPPPPAVNMPHTVELFACIPFNLASIDVIRNPAVLMAQVDPNQPGVLRVRADAMLGGGAPGGVPPAPAPGPY